MTRQKKLALWAVVEVQRGIPVEVTAFADEEAARRFKQARESRLNLQDDEVGVFFLDAIGVSSEVI